MSPCQVSGKTRWQFLGYEPSIIAGASAPTSDDVALRVGEIQVLPVNSNCQSLIPAAQRAFRRAMELKPSYVPARSWLAASYLALRRYAEAVALDEETVRIEPLSLHANVMLGWHLMWAKRHQESLRQLQHALELAPQLLMAHWLLGQAYMAVGRSDEGLAELRQSVELSGHQPWMVATVGCALAHVGRKAEAQDVLADLVRRSATEYVSAYYFTMLHAYLGDEETALVWLEKAREERNPYMPYLPAFADSDYFSGSLIPAKYLSTATRAAFIARLGIIWE